MTEKDITVGMISTDQVKKIPCSEWSTRTVGQIMSTLDDSQIIAPQMPVTKAYDAMVSAEINHLPVASNDQLAGIVTRDDILEDLYTHITVQN